MVKRGKLAFLIVFVILSLFIVFPQPVSALICITNLQCPFDYYCSLFACQPLECRNSPTSTCDIYNSNCGESNYCVYIGGNIPINHDCVYTSTSYAECAACPSLTADCDHQLSCETNVGSDVNNCGGCGNKCLSGWSCQSGSCEIIP